jgi:4-hydroxymandelate oxidase
VIAHEVEQRARELLAPEVYDFYAGAAGDETTAAANRVAWDAVQLLPRVLRSVDGVATAVRLLGLDLPHPVGVAPMGYQGVLHPDAELGTARGAAAAGALNVVSTRSSRSLEDVAAAAPDAPRWFQVYVLRDREWTAELARRAAAAGYGALVLTGDTPLLGRKHRDERNAYVVPDEHARGNLRVPRGAVEAQQDPTIDYETIGWLRDVSGLPVLVKGVLRADDARLCLDAGAAGVIVSNHGGRQLDGAAATADVLADVAAEVGRDGVVLVDGGVDSGLDVLRALALGADAVLVGRPVAWALAAGGAGGVTELLQGLEAELVRALSLAGCASLDACGPDLVRRR